MKGCERKGLSGVFCVASENNSCLVLEELQEAMNKRGVKPLTVKVKEIEARGCINGKGIEKYIKGLKENSGVKD